MLRSTSPTSASRRLDLRLPLRLSIDAARVLDEQRPPAWLRAASAIDDSFVWRARGAARAAPQRVAGPDVLGAGDVPATWVAQESVVATVSLAAGFSAGAPAT